MVDAIGAVNSNQIKPAKKDDSINWKGCTAEEIKGYEEQGQEVPDYILQWANEIAKIQSAPDDITYEMAISANITQSTQNPQTANAANDAAKDANNTEAEKNPSVAKALKSSLDGSNTSIEQQGAIFRDTSNQYNDEIQKAMDAMAGYLAQSEAAVTTAENTKNDVLSRVQSLIDRKNSLKSKKGDPSAQMEAQRVSMQIKTAGEGGLNAISNAAAPVDNAAGIIEGSKYTSATGRDIGNETINVGNQMPEGFLHISQRMAVIKSGERVIDKSSAGDAQFNDNTQTNNEYGSAVAGSKNEVTRATGAIERTDSTEAEENAEDKKAENDSTVNDAENDQTKSESTTKQTEVAQQEPETVDDKITTDPNEILKRKERKGLA